MDTDNFWNRVARIQHEQNIDVVTAMGVARAEIRIEARHAREARP